MARRGRYAKRSVPVRRDPLPIARTPVLHNRFTSFPLYSTPKSSPIPNWNPPLRDARRIPPSRRIPTTFSGTPAKLKPSYAKGLYPSSSLRIATPERSFTCARRKIRKEVIFASGHGGRKNRPPHYSRQSDVRC